MSKKSRLHWILEAWIKGMKSFKYSNTKKHYPFTAEWLSLASQYAKFYTRLTTLKAEMNLVQEGLTACSQNIWMAKTIINFVKDLFMLFPLGQSYWPLPAFFRGHMHLIKYLNLLLIYVVFKWLFQYTSNNPSPEEASNSSMWKYPEMKHCPFTAT